MSNYVFIISERGERTNILCDFEVITLEQLIKYLKEDLEIIEYNKDKQWNERKRGHILVSWGKKIRVAKINDFNNFQTRLLKYITLEEFEDIFQGHIKDITPLLEYKTNGDKYFRMDILKKYGIKKENESNE